MATCEPSWQQQYSYYDYSSTGSLTEVTTSLGDHIINVKQEIEMLKCMIEELRRENILLMGKMKKLYYAGEGQV